VDADAAAGPYTITLADEDGGLNYLTTEVIGVSFDKVEAPISIVGNITNVWMLY
jgi:hypothetical protein